MPLMTAVLVVLGVVGGSFVGLCLGVWIRDISRRDENQVAYQALRRVQNENGGLSESTRAAVLNALLEHENRSLR